MTAPTATTTTIPTTTTTETAMTTITATDRIATLVARNLASYLADGATIAECRADAADQDWRDVRDAARLPADLSELDVRAAWLAAHAAEAERVEADLAYLGADDDRDSWIAGYAAHWAAVSEAIAA